MKLIVVAGTLLALTVWAPKDTKQAVVTDTNWAVDPIPNIPDKNPPQLPEPKDYNCKWCW